MAAPVALAAGRKAAENPAASIFLMVLVGAIAIQAVKKLPDFGEWAWNRVVPFDVTAPIDYTYEAIQTTAALNEEVFRGIDQISPKGHDWFENFIFGDDVESVYAPGEISGVQEIYRAGRDNLFRAAWSRAGSLY